MTFRKSQPAFPHHSTLEQLFDPETVNAYRCLGQHLGRAVVPELAWDGPPPAPTVPPEANGVTAHHDDAPPDGRLAAELGELRAALTRSLGEVVAAMRPAAPVVVLPPAPVVDRNGDDSRWDDLLRAQFDDVRREFEETVRLGEHNRTAEVMRLHDQIADELVRVRAAMGQVERLADAAERYRVADRQALKQPLHDLRDELRRITEALQRMVARQQTVFAEPVQPTERPSLPGEL